MISIIQHFFIYWSDQFDRQIVETKKDDTLEALMKRIIEDKYPHGSKLPSERILCKELEISRASLREVIPILQKWNVVQSLKGSGISIIDRSNWTIDVIPFILKYSVVDQEYIRLVNELLVIRRKLVNDVFSMIKGRKLNLEAAKNCVEMAWENRSSISEFVKYDSQTLHMICIEANLNACVWLWNTLDRIYQQIALLLPFQIHIPKTYKDQNLKILRALERGRTQRAILLSATLMSNIEKGLIKLLQQEMRHHA